MPAENLISYSVKSVLPQLSPSRASNTEPVNPDVSELAFSLEIRHRKCLVASASHVRKSTLAKPGVVELFL